MDNYVPSDDSEEVNALLPFPPQYTENVKIMKINKGTKFQNIVNFVLKYFEDPSQRYVIFEGIGDAADKCISCVEVLKRKTPETFYQWNGFGFSRKVTYWDPIMEDLQRLKVTIDTPVMYILVSRDSFPDHLKCDSIQPSNENILPKSRQTGPNRNKNNKNKPKGNCPNKWARPDKAERDRMSTERNQALAHIMKE